MCEKVKNLPLNSSSVGRIAERAMSDRGMRITDRFKPVETAVYSYRIGDGKRVLMTLDEDMFQYSELSKCPSPSKEWKVTKEYFVQGSLNDVENAFIRALKRLKKQL